MNLPCSSREASLARAFCRSSTARLGDRGNWGSYTPAKRRKCPASTLHQRLRLSGEDLGATGAGSPDASQLANDPAIFRRERLHRKRHSDEDKERRVAGRPGLDQGPGRQSLDQHRWVPPMGRRPSTSILGSIALIEIAITDHGKSR